MNVAFVWRKTNKSMNLGLGGYLLESWKTDSMPKFLMVLVFHRFREQYACRTHGLPCLRKKTAKPANEQPNVD